MTPEQEHYKKEHQDNIVNIIEKGYEMTVEDRIAMELWQQGAKESDLKFLNGIMEDSKRLAVQNALRDLEIKMKRMP